MYTSYQLLSDGSSTPFSTSHPEKMMLAHWACAESRARAPAKASIQLGNWINMQKDQMKKFLIWAVERTKFWDPTWSSKPWRMGVEGFFCLIKWIFSLLLISQPPWMFHKPYSCPEQCLVSHLSTLPHVVWLSYILFCEPPSYLVLIHFGGSWSVCLSSMCYPIYRG